MSPYVDLDRDRHLPFRRSDGVPDLIIDRGTISASPLLLEECRLDVDRNLACGNMLFGYI
jgi:hypothetical protein